MAVNDTAWTVKLWEDALKQVERLPAGSPRAGSSQQHAAGAPLTPVDDVLPTVDEFLELPDLQPALWTKLVAVMKIPLQLGKAASTSDPLAPKATAAVGALGVLIYKATSDHQLQLGAPNTFSQHLGQQLKQSGFLAALPKLLEAAATALANTQRNPEVLAAMPHNLDLIRNSGASEHSAAARHVMRMQEFASWLLLIVSSSVYFWPQQFDRVAAAAPALRLCVITMQHCSCCAELIPTASAAAAARVAPTALEQQMATAYTAGQAVFAAWDKERLAQDDFDLSVLECPDAMRAVCCLLMMPTVCPQQFFAETEEFITSLEGRTRDTVKVRHNTPASNSSSLSAWQYACAHASEVTDIQQQTLQALGCSSRLFMYMAGNALTELMNSNTILGLANVYFMLARHSAPLVGLDKPETVRQLAAQLQQLQEGAMPPCSSPLLPCAPLLWLMPAALLQWAGKQPACGPHFAQQNVMFSTLLWPSAGHALQQHDCWSHAESVLYEAAGGSAAQMEQQQAIARTMLAAMTGVPMPPVVPASQQNLTPEQARQANAEKRMYLSASATADKLSKAWLPPGASLAQLLRQAGGSAVRMLACMQAATPAADPAGSNDSSSSSSSSHSKPECTKPSSSSSSSGKGQSSNKSHSKYGDVAPVSSILRTALLRLPQGSVALLNLSYRVLWYFVNRAGMAARHDPMIGLEWCGVLERPDRIGVGPGTLDDQEQAGLSALCAALQETLPQLASLVDAAVRTSMQEEPRVALLAVGSNFMRAVQAPGVFVAAGLQPGSPALKPLASLTATLLKVVGAAQANLAQDPEGFRVSAIALRNVTGLNSMVLEVACSSSSSSGSGSGDPNPDGIIAVLTTSKAVREQDCTWSAEDLTTISNACKPASSIGSSGSGSDGRGSMDAVSMMPWLAGLGRCCLGYVGTLKCVAAAATAAGGDNSLIVTSCTVHNLDIMGEVLKGVSAVLPGWLRNRNISAQLASAGYVSEPLPGLLQSLFEAQENAAQAGPAVLAQRAQELGVGLSSMPFGSACNNTMCRELSELSEQQLVVGSASKCSGCRVARYCSKACQKVHWKQHKPACKAIAAATKAPVAST